MTVQEAKDFVQGKLNCMDRCDLFECKNTDECDGCEYCYSQGNFGEQKEAFQVAIKCIEKQIPKKPNIVGDFIRLAECSECHTVIQFKQEYCHKCGNKVGWEEGGTSD